VLVSNANGVTPSSNATLAVVTSWIFGWGNNTLGQLTVPPTVINPVAIGLGDDSNLALNSDGTVVGWGLSGYGEAAIPPGLSNVIAISMESDTSLALKSDGTIAAWGWNFYGMTNYPPRLADVTQLAGGGFHALALRTDGTVVAWGRDLEGQTDMPPGLTNVVAVGAGGFHSLALKRDSTVVAWGDNSQGQCDVPPGLTNVVAVCGVSHSSLALVEDGTLLCWGADGVDLTNKPPAGLTNIVAVTPNHAVRSDGTLVVWGDNSQGQTNVPPGLSNVVASVGDAYVTLALVNDGSPWIVRQPTSRAVYRGQDTVLKLTALGTPPLSYQWQRNGTNLDGATNSSLFLANVQMETQGQYQVVLSNAFGMLVSSNAAITVVPPAAAVVFQPASQSALPGGMATFSVLAAGIEPLSYQWRQNGVAIDGATNSSLALTAVGAANLGGYDVVVVNPLGSITSSVARLTIAQVVAWGDNTYGQTNVPPALSNVVALAAGYYHTLALKNDGTVAAWGASTNNLLPILDYGQSHVPEGLSNVVTVSAGTYHSLALRSDGTVAAWGYDADGQTNVPAGLGKAVALQAGYFHNLAVRADGTVAAWGNNDHGQTNVPVGLSNVMAVAGGAYHSLALTRNGTVVAWGYNDAGQSSVPAGLSNVVAIAAGGCHNLALKNDGTMVAWGWSVLGQCAVPPGLTNVVSIAAGYEHSMAVDRDGLVYAWGENNYGQAVVPVGLANAVVAGAGGGYSAALLNDGCPFLVTQPTNRTLFTGQAATLEASAWGSPALHYQWQQNGANLPGATDAVLIIPDAQRANAGSYRIVVTNDYGSVMSSSATLSVIAAAILLDDGGFGLRSNQFCFTARSAPSQAVAVETSTNLVDWATLQTGQTTDAGLFFFTDPDWATVPHRFYRVRLN
jgi:alpha-tubulin suppressor-like RCC1 family protein